MRFIELSSKDVEKTSREWAENVFKEYRPDLIIYLARAGYIFAKPMAESIDVPLLGVGAVRSGNGFKEKIAPIMVYCPRLVKNAIAALEIKLGVHKRKTERKVSFHPSINDLQKEAFRKVLIVDDAVDTGYSMKEAVEKTREAFPQAEIRTMCMNLSCKEEDCVIHVDYVLMHEVIMKTPFSKDSKEYRQTREAYYRETRNEYI